MTYFNLQSYLKPHFVSLPKKSKNSNTDKVDLKDVPNEDSTVVETAEVTKKMKVGKKKSKKTAVPVNTEENEV